MTYVSRRDTQARVFCVLSFDPCQDDDDTVDDRDENKPSNYHISVEIYHLNFSIKKI
jgi:hypothetical protein